MQKRGQRHGRRRSSGCRSRQLQVDDKRGRKGGREGESEGERERERDKFIDNQVDD